MKQEPALQSFHNGIKNNFYLQIFTFYILYLINGFFKVECRYGLHRFNPSRHKNVKFALVLLKFIYSKKATNFCEISTLLLTVCTVVKKKGEDFAKICGLLRIHELYETDVKMQIPVSKLKNSNDQFPCAV